jgi:hypothetical protein
MLTDYKFRHGVGQTAECARGLLTTTTTTTTNRRLTFPTVMTFHIVAVTQAVPLSGRNIKYSGGFSYVNLS